jgi:hypothetical protein
MERGEESRAEERIEEKRVEGRDRAETSSPSS